MQTKTVKMLIKRELTEKRQSLIWLSLLTTLILFFTFPKQLFTANLQDGHGFIRFLFVSVGAYLAGSSFWEFSSAAKARSYLLIPAHTLEKITAKISVYIFGWWLLFILAWLIAGTLANLAFSILTGTFTLHNFFNSLFSILKILLPTLPAIFLLQSLGIFASCYFKKSALFKLAVALLGLGLLIASLTLAEVSLLVKYFGLAQMSSAPLLSQGLNFKLISCLANSGSIIIGVIACLLSWLRLRETEAR
ncbi:MAG: hypothetical protein KA049_00015 [Burkholderiales bacterium]|jgi:hypothetical protein|nr:hypothetical protein [Burkholderiales bacterium]MBP9769815.1 hypothetical protein [Burkholderiales bacterium]